MNKKTKRKPLPPPPPAAAARKGKGPPPPPRPVTRTEPKHHSIASCEGDQREVISDLITEMKQLGDALRADPVAQAAVKRIEFATLTIERSGRDIVRLIDEAVREGFARDGIMRSWVKNLVVDARALLERAKE